MGTQLGLFESIMDLLYVKPLFILGLALIGAVMLAIFRKHRQLPKIRITVSAFLMYYYLCIVMENIVGIPSIREFTRLSELGESFFNPNINLIPFTDGVDLGFILNIFCFIPLGFLSPAISSTYAKLKNTLLLGLGLSLIVEISQLFTLYRATDINDLIANVLGTLIGCLSFKLIFKKIRPNSSTVKDAARFLPPLVILCSFVLIFLI